MTLSDTINYLLKDRNSLIFRYFFASLYFLLKGSLITKLNDHNFEILIFEAFIAFQYVLRVKFHH